MDSQKQKLAKLTEVREWLDTNEIEYSWFYPDKFIIFGPPGEPVFMTYWAHSQNYNLAVDKPHVKNSQFNKAKYLILVHYLNFYRNKYRGIGTLAQPFD